MATSCCIVVASRPHLLYLRCSRTFLSLNRKEARAATSRCLLTASCCRLAVTSSGLYLLSSWLRITINYWFWPRFGKSSTNNPYLSVGLLFD